MKPLLDHFRGSMLMQFDVRRFDIYRKVPKDLTKPTYVGACISITSISVIVLLFISELIAFITPELESNLYVGDPGRDQVPVFLDMTLTELNCEFIGIDIQDDLGRHEVGNLERFVKDPTADKKGCNIVAKFEINKVPGNFHVSTHAKGGTKSPSFKHVINRLRFGNPVGGKIQNVYGIKDCSFQPLDGVNYTDSSLSGRETYDYHIKIVPSSFNDGSGFGTYTTYQFTALQKKYETNQQGMRMFPAIWFKYQLTPITVKYTLKEKPLYHFMTTVCAIVGGTFTVAGIIDSCIFTAHEVFKKMEMGKLG